MDLKFNLGGLGDDEEKDTQDKGGFDFFGGANNHDDLDLLDPAMQSSKISRSIREKSLEEGDLMPDFEAELVVKMNYKEEAQTLNEYELLDKIGGGSFGKIVRVSRSFYEDDGVTIVKSIYVFKVLKKSKKVRYVIDEKGQQQLKTEQDLIYNELAIYKNLNCVNICKLYQIIDCPYEENMYLVMQYCDLGQLLLLDEQEQSYSPNTKIDLFTQETYNIKEPDEMKKREALAKIIFKQICQGVKYLHDRKIVNRDIKIDNILAKSIDCDKGEHYKLIDFSTALKLKSHHQKVFGQAGTPAYYSPEMCLPPKDGYDGKATDIWSLGITIYTYVNVHLPFLFKGDDQEVQTQIINDTIHFEKHNTPLFIDLIEGMCKKAPKERLKIDQVINHLWFQE